MEVVVSPSPLPAHIDLFVAGGISNCPDWQNSILNLLRFTRGTAVNPRRPGDLAKTGEEAAKQISWEHSALSRAKSVLFWFPQESLGPISLLELGAAMMRPEQVLFVGTHPNYARRFDVVQQLSLQRPDVVTVHDNLTSLAREVHSFFAN